MRPLRILRNQEGGSPGGGQQPPPSPAPQQPPANPAAPLTRDDLLAFGEQIAQKARDGVFADLRRAGVLSDKPKGKTPAAPAQKTGEEGDPALTATSNPISASQGRVLDRTVARLAIGPKLSERQYARMEQDFANESPGDPETWVKQWASDFGIATEQPKPADPPAGGKPGTQQQPPANAGNPLTGRLGTPPVSQVPVEELNLWTCSEADRLAYIKAKGNAEFVKKLREQGKGVKVKTRD